MEKKKKLDSLVAEFETGRAQVVNEAQMRLRQVRAQHEANSRCCCCQVIGQQLN